MGIPLPISMRMAACRHCCFASRHAGLVRLRSVCSMGKKSVGSMIESAGACPSGRFPSLDIPLGHLVISNNAISGWKDGPRACSSC